MSRFKLGLQLYSVRDFMEKDVEATLKAVSEMGYECVEFAGYFGKTAEEMKALCDKYNLAAISVHQTHDVFLKDPKTNIEYLKTLGVKFSAIPWMDVNDWKNDYDRLISEITEVGKLLKDNGIGLLYHNHEFEFTIKHGDDYVLDALYKDVPSDILCPELDMCWVHYSGNDPIEYVKKYGDVMKLLHVKDFECEKLCSGPVYALVDENGKETMDPKKGRESNSFEFRPVGYGRQDIPAIMKAAEDTNIEYIIVEQDQHTTGNDALQDAKISIDYLHSLGY